MEKRQRKIQETEKSLTPEAELLNNFLNQYKYCIRTKKNLENRRLEITREFNTPLASVKNVVKSDAEKKGEGCATLVFQLDEINEQIKEQIERSVKTLKNIFYIINYLPENTMERAIIENRYIDCYKWEKICQINNISRTPAIKAWKKGLYMLLELKEVKKILKDFKAE